MIDRRLTGVPGLAMIRNLRPALAAIHPAFASEAFWQLVRYIVAGLAVTVFAALIYSAAATLLGIPPLAANALSSMCGVTASYAVHSRWSFAAERGDGERGMMLRFLVAAAFAFALNSFWVWLATQPPASAADRAGAGDDLRHAVRQLPSQPLLGFRGRLIRTGASVSAPAAAAAPAIRPRAGRWRRPGPAATKRMRVPMSHCSALWALSPSKVTRISAWPDSAPMKPLPFHCGKRLPV